MTKHWGLYTWTLTIVVQDKFSFTPKWYEELQIVGFPSFSLVTYHSNHISKDQKDFGCIIDHISTMVISVVQSLKANALFWLS